jgi:methionine-rich copper-binding protein CopC
MSARILTLGLALLLAGGATAEAHAFLRTATPPVGATVTAPPTEVAITFTEGVEPKFSTIEVRDSGGARVDRGDPHNPQGVQTRLIVSLGALKPGVYSVNWSAISVDTHHTEGKFTFTVAPPGTAP